MSGADGDSFLASRGSAGLASGALDGRFPFPQLGPAVCSSYGVHEHWLGDFLKASPFSAMKWRVTDIAGGCTPSNVAVSSASERGILRLSSGTGLLDGGTVGLPNATYSGPDVGTLWVVKMRLPTTNTQMIAWSGLSSGLGSTPADLTGMSFVGLRVIAAGAAVNWYGVQKDGASSEESLDLGVAADTTWRILGFRVLADETVFYTGNASDRDRGLVLTEVGRVGTHRPTAALYPIAQGVLATSAAQRDLDQDFVDVGGSVAA